MKFQKNIFKFDVWSIAGDRSKLLAAFVSVDVLSAANKLRRLALCAFICVLYICQKDSLV